MDAEGLSDLSGGPVTLDGLNGDLRLQAGRVILASAGPCCLSFIFNAAAELRKGLFCVQFLGSTTASGFLC